jgi:aspartate racemase
MSGNYQLIGLIGGVGPWAGLDVHRKILEESAYEREQECVSVMHLSFPGKYTDRTDYILGKTTVNPAHAFLRELQFLENAGAASAAIVCNTAHADPILDLIEAGMIGSTMRYVNIIRETQAVLKRDAVQRIGLLATLGTYSLDIYRNQCDSEVIYPDKKNQQRVHNIVYNAQNGLKTHYPKCVDELYPELLSVARSLIADGAEALVLGCTELPLLTELGKYIDVPVYDPNRILARALIAQAGQPAATESLSVIYNQS